MMMINVSNETMFKLSKNKQNNNGIKQNTFDDEMTKARDECSFMFPVNESNDKNKTLEIIKEKIMEKKLKELDVKKKTEKLRDKKYYENVRKESRKKIFRNENNFPPLPPPPPQFSTRRFNKRSTRRRKNNNNNNKFSTVHFIDHKNCTNRCILSRMELVSD